MRDTLWNRVEYLASNNIPAETQLQELMGYQEKLKNCKTPRDSLDAYLLQRIGVMYFKKGDYASSVSYTKQAIDLLHILQRKTYVNPNQKFRCYRNLTIYYDSLGLLAKRNESTDSSISIALNANLIDTLLLYAISFKIINLLNNGDYLRCIQYASLCQNLAEKYGYTHSNIFKRIFTWKMDALILLHEYPQVYLDLKNKVEEYKYFKHDDFRENLYGLLGSYYSNTGNTDSALISYNKAFELYLSDKNDPGCAYALNCIGIEYSGIRDFKKALIYYNKALLYADAKAAINIYDNIGNVFVKQELFDSAFHFYQKAFDQIRPGIDENSLQSKVTDEVTDNIVEDVVSLILDKADACLYQYKRSQNEQLLRKTLNTYKIADQILDKIKNNQFETQSRLYWRSNIRRLYEHAIETCWMVNNTERGFYFFEKSRAVLLEDQLKEERLMQEKDISKQYQLKSKINRLEKELDSSKIYSEQYSRIQTEILNNKEELDGFLLGIREKDPLYVARNSNAELIGTGNIQKIILKDQDALLEIFEGDSSLYILRVTKSESNISKINKHLFDSLSHEFLTLVSNSGLQTIQYRTFIQVSQSLYHLIFPGSALPKGRIIISPDGEMIPFEALISNSGPDIRYMLEDYSISYTYSARFLMSHFADNSVTRHADFMGMAPVDYAPYLNLTSLSGSEASIDLIKEHFRNPFTVTAKAATKNAFLSNFSDYRIVQIYSHASYRDSSGKPVIYFADSSMDLSELFSKEKPAARLVVLSACETALGKEYKGEGVFSFSREFAALGIPASVSNLWSVDNESTYRITEWFYKFVADGLPTDEALRQAKLKFISESTGEKKLPFYWASSILTGKAEIIRTKSRFPFGDIMVVTGITGLAILFMKRKRGRKKTGLLF